VVTTVDVSYHQFLLVDAGHRPDPGSVSRNGLVAVAGPGAAVVYTGISSGAVAVSVEARTTPPAAVDTDGWDEIVEVGMAAPAGRIRVAALMADPPADLADLTAAGPGPYRVRIHARGRDTAPDGVSREPVESYLIVAWPGADEAERVHRRTDRYGAGLRASMARAHQPPARPVDPHRAVIDEALRRARNQRAR
jgi:hypothetical protein